MADIRVAGRYVKSLLSLAIEQGAVDAVHADMQMFSSTLQKSKELDAMLRSPIIPHERKRTVLEKLLKGKVHPLTFAIVDILTRKNREPLLPSIAREFHNAYNDCKGISKASVVTPVPLDATLRAQIEQMVKTLSHRNQVELDEKVDKNLIGGFILNVGDQQVDTSVKSKLKALNVKFRKNPYVKTLNI